MKEKALFYFNNGYSCSESIIKAAIDEGLCDPILLSCATSFSGGMSLGCVCGTVAAAQIISGFHFGRANINGNEVSARERPLSLSRNLKSVTKLPAVKFYPAG